MKREERNQRRAKKQWHIPGGRRGRRLRSGWNARAHGHVDDPDDVAEHSADEAAETEPEGDRVQLRVVLRLRHYRQDQTRQTAGTAAAAAADHNDYRLQQRHDPRRLEDWGISAWSSELVGRLRDHHDGLRGGHWGLHSASGSDSSHFTEYNSDIPATLTLFLSELTYYLLFISIISKL